MLAELFSNTSNVADIVLYTLYIRLLVKSTGHNRALWLSTDFGRKWDLIHEYVISAKWDPSVNGGFYYVVDPLKRMSRNFVVF